MDQANYSGLLYEHAYKQIIQDYSMNMHINKLILSKMETIIFLNCLNVYLLL